MVLCTSSNVRSLKSCVLLVVFCFSLVVACIKPAFAATYTDSDPSFLLYSGIPGSDPSYSSNPSPVPCLSNTALFSFRSTGVPYHLNFSSSHFEPFSESVTLYLVVGVSCSDGIVSSNQGHIWNTEFVVQQSAKGSDRFEGYRAWYRGQAQVSTHNLYMGLEIPLHSQTSVFYFDTSEWTFTPPSGKDFGVFLDCAYLIYSSDHDIVSIVVDILNEVRQINGNTSSALSVLNEILSQCISINADTSTIISLLKTVKAQIVSLYGKVDDIYKLLKDSLANESAAVDQKSAQLGGEIMQRVDSEQYWSDKNTETFNALDLGNFTFGDGVVSALPVVGNLFKGLWDSFGDATLIITFPLMLGVALVIVGRISRSSGKGSKKGGDDG